MDDTLSRVSYPLQSCKHIRVGYWHRRRFSLPAVFVLKLFGCEASFLFFSPQFWIFLRCSLCSPSKITKYFSMKRSTWKVPWYVDISWGLTSYKWEHLVLGGVWLLLLIEIFKFEKKFQQWISGLLPSNYGWLVFYSLFALDVRGCWLCEVKPRYSSPPFSLTIIRLQWFLHCQE